MNTTQMNTPWLLCPRPNSDAKLRLFCFPYAGGGDQVYRKWADQLPEIVETYLVQLPGRGSRLLEKPFTNLVDLSKSLAGAMLSYLDKPFILFGHSMGAMVSFELARQLRRGGLQPLHIFASGCHAPQIPDSSVLHDLPESELIRELHRLNGTPKEVLENRELLSIIIPTLRADCMVTETYVYTNEPPLNCPITVFGGLRDPLVKREELDAWREQTNASFSLRMLEGDHFFLHTSTPVLLSSLSKELYQLASSLE
jgi:medium-chain acyl-[acyl-carrier-protein] hydrolase